jgi:hypothetical protein
MRPSLFKFVIASVLFLGIVGATLAWLVTGIPSNPGVPPIKGDLELPSPQPTIDYTTYSVPFCELIQNPTRYDRKLIRTKCTYVFDVDFYYLKSDKCGTEDIQVTLAAVEPGDKSLESKSTERVGPMFEWLARRDRDAEVEIDVVGRFYIKDKLHNSAAFAMLDILDAKPTANRLSQTRASNEPSNKSLDRSADSLFLNLFGAAKVECNRRARSTQPFAGYL